MQRSHAPETWYQLGAIALRRGRLSEAADHFRRGDRDSQDDSDLRYHFRARLAEIRARRGDMAGATRDLTSASDALDQWRAQLSESDLRAQAFGANRDDVDPDLGIATILAGMAASGRIDEAFALAERRRARQLLDQLNQGVVVGGDTATSIPPAARNKPPSAMDVRQALAPGVALVEYVTGRGGEPTTAFVFTRAGLQSVSLVPIDSVAPFLARLNVLLEDNQSPMALATMVRQAVLDPVLAVIPESISTLLIVPDGALHSVPFGALLVMQPAGRSLSISTVPSAGVALDLWRRVRRDRTPSLLAFGDPLYQKETGTRGGAGVLLRSVFDSAGGLPRLEASAREVERVALFAAPATVLVRGRASESQLKRQALNTYSILHFATHAIVSDRTPTRTALALTAGEGEDGFVMPGELAALPLDADLVVLSACRTAGGNIVRGEGVQGLSTPLLAAGARAVLATNWRVGDRATEQFMERFYGAVASGLTLGAALHRAQLEARRAGAEVREWSAFTLVGDPTIRIALTEPPAGSLRTWLLVGLAVATFAGLTVALRRVRPARTS